MTNTQLAEIQPRELKFTFEVKKQSSCTVHVVNITDQYVAFKVKTTSPKKYCVRPNIGVVKPNSTHDFTVTMQAQRTAPSDLQCKDKFLIQCTVVPFGISEEEITPGMFNKNDGKYIEESKLRVVLVSPPHSPVLQPANGISKGASIETSMQQEKFPIGVENLPPAQIVVKNNKDSRFEEETVEPRMEQIVDGIDLNFAKNLESYTDEVVEKSKDADFVAEAETRAKTVEDIELNLPTNRESYTNEVVEPRQLKSMEKTDLALFTDVKELKSKINVLESQLIEAEFIIAKLKEEKRTTIQDKEVLKQDLALLRTKRVGRKVRVGFPPLFICMVALIGLTIGFLLRA